MLYQRGECGCGTRARPIESKLAVALRKPCSASQTSVRRDGRVAEGARLESVFRGNSNVGSNPTLSARTYIFLIVFPGIKPVRKQIRSLPAISEADWNSSP